jgi:sarcosine oxidase subunit alpha
MGTEETVAIRVDGREVRAARGASVAAALLNAGVVRFRRSVTGEERGPLCGRGICFECRVTIDGVAHRKSCQVTVREGMEVVTDG